METPGLRARRPRRGHHRIRSIVLGLAFIGAGLIVFRYASEIANEVDRFVAPPPEGTNVTGSGFAQAGYLPFVVWGSGFTLIGIGATMLRSAFLSPMGGMGGGSPLDGMGMGGMPPDAMNAYMQQAMSTQAALAARPGAEPTAAKEVVKIKCRSCGSLEAEDAAFCRKCGNPL